LRGRTERLCPFGSLEEVEACLEELSRGDAPLVRMLTPRPGQKERRYAQLLSSEPAEIAASTEDNIPAARAHAVEQPSRLEALENEVATLKTELQQLREEFTSFRRQFE